MFNFEDLDNAVRIISSSLESGDRRKRKNIIEELNKELSQYNSENPELGIYFDAVRHSVWPVLSDLSETVRDSAINMILVVLQKMPSNNQYLEELMPIILHRLDKHENCEPSEEIRLKLIELLLIIIDKFLDNIDCYTQDILHILAVNLVEKYPKIRQESGKCCIALTNNCAAAMYEQSYKLVKPILTSFRHNHSRTRITAVNALEAVLREASWKNIDAQLVFGSLGERLFDDNAGVRLAVVNLLGSWLLHLRDRYSFFSRLVPLTLSCLADEEPEVSARAWAIWSAAGRLYLSENEQDLKDKIDYLDEKPLHYPSNVERPNLGCRALLIRHTYQICTPLIAELTDWQPRVCIKASMLLSLLVLHAEMDLTQHLETLLSAMYRVAENKGDIVPPQCRDYIDRAAEYIGFFIGPSTWLKLVLPMIELEPNQGNLFVLAAIIRGSSPNSLAADAERISQLLSCQDICGTMRMTMQLESLKCCRALLDNLDSVTDKAAEYLLTGLCYITAATEFDPDRKSLAIAGQGCLKILADKMQSNEKELIKSKVKLLLGGVVLTVDAWSPAHPNFRLILFILSQPGLLWYETRSEIEAILKAALRLDRGDVEVKSYLFISIADIFERNIWSQASEEDIIHFSSNVLKDLIAPNLTWKAGLSAEKLRTVVLACLVNVTRHLSQLKSPGLPTSELVPGVIACVSDTLTVNRAFALQSLINIIQIIRQNNCLADSLVNDIYQPVVERLDDIDEKVRSSAVRALTALFSNLPPEYTETSHSPVFSHLVTAMMPYLDDDDPIFQNSVCDALKILVPKAPKTFKEKISGRKHLFKSQHLCSELLELAQEV